MLSVHYSVSRIFCLPDVTFGDQLRDAGDARLPGVHVTDIRMVRRRITIRDLRDDSFEIITDLPANILINLTTSSQLRRNQ